MSAHPSGADAPVAGDEPGPDSNRARAVLIGHADSDPRVGRVYYHHFGEFGLAPDARDPCLDDYLATLERTHGQLCLRLGTDNDERADVCLYREQTGILRLATADGDDRGAVSHEAVLDAYAAADHISVLPRTAYPGAITEYGRRS